MNIIQIALIFFGLFMVYVVRLNYRKKQIGRWEFLLWVFMWILFITVNIMPNIFLGVAHSLQVARVFDLFVIFALMILSLMSFENHFHLKKIDHKLDEIVRNRALDHLAKSPKKR